MVVHWLVIGHWSVVGHSMLNGILITLLKYFRQYIVTTPMCDTTSKQNLETIVEAIRHLEGDHLFSEEAGPHQVVKEEVVESCIIEDNGNVVEMTLPGSVFTSSAIINSLPQVPVPMTSSGGSVVTGSSQQQGSYQLTVSLPTVPVASMQNQTQQIQVGGKEIFCKKIILIFHH